MRTIDPEHAACAHDFLSKMLAFERDPNEPAPRSAVDSLLNIV
jgi:hypothetical protein